MYRNDGNHLHLFGKLFHQFIVDMYAKIDQGRLSFLRHNQVTLRRDIQQGVQDAVFSGDEDMSNVDKKNHFTKFFYWWSQTYDAIIPRYHQYCQKIR